MDVVNETDDVRVRLEEIQAGLLRMELTEKRRAAEAKARGHLLLASVGGVTAVILLLGVGALVLADHGKEPPEFIATAMNIAVTGLVSMLSFHAGKADNRKTPE